MKKIIFPITILISLFTFSAQGAELKIGYLDLNKVLNESDNGKKATKLLDDMVNSKQALISKKEEEINKLKEELEKQSSVLTPESMKDKQDHLNKLIKDAQRMVRDFQEEIQKKEIELRTEIIKELREIINKIGEEEDYAVIFTGESGLLYYQKKIDITDKVIKGYNETTKAKK